MSDLYQNNPIVGKLREIYMEIFSRQTMPTATNLVLVCLSMLILNACPSIRFAYRHCIKFLTSKKLKTFYHTFGKADLLRDWWWRALLHMVIAVRRPGLSNAPILISFDDSIVSKSGTHFDFARSLFDHSIKSGDKFVNGHCFVSFVVSVPVGVSGSGEYTYISIPLLHRMWRGGQNGQTNQQSQPEIETKLTIARDYIIAIVQEFRNAGVTSKIYLLCDSWYSKGPLLSVLKPGEVEIVCAVRSDTFMTALPEIPTERRRGRPKKYGRRLHLDDIYLMHINGTGYSVGRDTVMTKLFNFPVEAFVTEKTDSGKKSRRLYLCSDLTLADSLPPGLQLEGDVKSFAVSDHGLLPLALYRKRWDVETCFYELKTFWGMRDYRLLSVDGMENLLNLQLLNYSLMILLPRMDSCFAPLADLSVQDRRFSLGRLLSRLIFIEQLSRNGPKGKKSFSFRKCCMQLMRNESLGA